MTHRLVALLAALTLAGLLGGCAAERANTRGMTLIENGSPEQGLAELERAMRLEPTNARFRVDYIKQQSLLVQAAMQRAQAARARGDLGATREHLNAALRVDAASDPARRGLAMLAVEEHQQALVAEAGRLADAGRLDAAREKLRLAALDNPTSAAVARAMGQLQERLDKAAAERDARIAATSVMKKPVTLQFRDANVRMVFEALSRTTGLNVIMDRDVRADLKTTIFVRDASVEDTVDLILLQNQLDKKVLNANTLFIYPATAAKQKEYQDLKVRTFQLSNADAKYVQTVLKSVLKVKDIALDERTNTLVLRDTPDTIAVAEKIVLAHDLADAEVMLEVEVLEVSRERLTNLGVKWPEGASISTPTDVNGQLTLGALRDLTGSQLLITPLSAGINLRLTDNDANLLASPRIRVRHKEKARILIGDKVPVITNTVTPVSQGGSVVTGSVQYLDVGIKLEAEPHVYLESEVGIKLNLEVSNIVREIAGPQGSLAYQIGTRSAATSLRLRDGETQVLGGLISDQDRNSAAKVPGLGQLPVLGRLFSNNTGTAGKNEIVLAITPRIVRSAALAETRYRDVYSGSEAAVRENPLRLDPVGSVSSSAASVPFVAPGGPRAAPLAETGPAGATGAAAGGASATPGAPAPQGPSAQPPAQGPAAGGLPAAIGGTTTGATDTPETAPPATAPRTPSAPPPTTTPVNPASLPPAIRPGGIYQPAPPPQPAAPRPTPRPAPPDETSDAADTLERARVAAAQPAAAGAPSAAPAAAQGGLQFAWQGPYRVKVGQEFEVALDVTAPRALAAPVLVVRFDPSVLTFLDAQLTEFASKNGITAVAPAADPATGTLRLDLTLAPGRFISGQGTLLNLRFAARAVRMQTQLSLGEAGATAGGAATRPVALTLRVGA